MVIVCAVPGCRKEAWTVQSGFALCEECYDASLEIPEDMAGHVMIRVLMRVDEAPEELDALAAVRWAVEDVRKDIEARS